MRELLSNSFLTHSRVWVSGYSNNFCPPLFKPNPFSKLNNSWKTGNWRWDILKVYCLQSFWKFVAKITQSTIFIFTIIITNFCSFCSTQLNAFFILKIAKQMNGEHAEEQGFQLDTIILKLCYKILKYILLYLYYYY